MFPVVNVVHTSGLSHFSSLPTQQVFQRCTMKPLLNLVFVVTILSQYYCTSRTRQLATHKKKLDNEPLRKVCSSMQDKNKISRFKKSKEMQQNAVIYLWLICCACFGHPSRPSSGVHKTVVAAFGTDHIIWRASFFKRGLWSR